MYKQLLFLLVLWVGLGIKTYAQNNALSFDGVNDFVATPVIGYNLNSFTIETWINPASIPLTGNIAILNTNTWDASGGCSIHFQFEAGNIVLSVYSLSADWPAMRTKLTTNKWQHIAVTYDRTNSTVKFYLNGVLDNTITKALPLAKIDASKIGAWNSSRYFNGKLDELRVWNVVRSVTDIANNMNVSISSPASVQGLIAYYPFNQGTAGGNNTSVKTLYDFSVSGYNGTLTNFDLGTSNWGERTTGNNCLTFDGIDDFVNLGASEMINFGGGFSVTGLMKWDKFNSWSRMIDFGNGAGSDNIVLANNATNSFLSFSIRRGTAETMIHSAKFLNTNQWYYIAATVSVAGVVNLYIDGVLDKTATGFYLPNSMVRNNQYLGKSAWATDSYFNGSIDNISVWNKALSQAEITAGASGFAGNETGLVHYYNFNQGVVSGDNAGVTQLNDGVSVNTKNGTLTNFRLQPVNVSNWVSGEKVWNITYNLNGGINDGSNTATYSQGVVLTLADPTRSNYTFGGWFENPTFTGVATTAVNALRAGDITLYAKWIPDTYLINYVLNGGTNPGANTPNYTYGVGLTLSAPSKTGNTFGGWYSNESFTGIAITSISATNTGNVSLYAKWTANTYSVSYILNDGTISEPNGSSYTFGIGLPLNDPVKPGYQFGGWFDNEYFVGSPFAAIDPGMTGNITLYAMWMIPFAGGKGTEPDPWLISTPAQLSQLNLYLTAGHSDKYFRIINDIDLATYLSAGNPGYNNGYGWLRIGSDNEKFFGKVDGAGHIISGLFIDATKAPYPSYSSNIGLFGYTGNAFSLKNLTLHSNGVIGEYQAGAMVGTNGGAIVNCHVVMQNNSKVGYPPFGLIANIGGFAGYNSGWVSQCSVSGGVIGHSNIGGFVGANNFQGVIESCYATGIVQGSESVGGFAGGNSNSISKCYTSVIMEWDVALTKNKGGFSSNSSNNANCYWNKELSTLATSPGLDAALFGKTTAQMKLQNTFSGWDFVGETVNGTVDIWAISPAFNNGYPCFKRQLMPFVNTRQVSAIKATSATATGEIASLGVSNPTQYGTVWSTAANPTTSLATKTEQGAFATKGLFTSSITNLLPNTTYYAKTYATNANGTVYGDEITFTTPTTGTWTGATSTDWATSSNWAGENVPTETTDVIIPDVTNDPVIGTITKAYCKNLTIDATANLTIQSSATGTGSLIIRGTVTGNANVQRYLTGYAFHIVSPPVLEQKIPAFLTTNSLVDAIPVTGIRALKHYIESSDNWGQYYNNSTTGIMGNANGYVTYLKADGTISFSGKLQSGPTTVTVTRDKNGWNCIGNPYSSAIAINDAAGSTNFIRVNATNIDQNYGAIYLWDQERYSYTIISLASVDAFYAQLGQGFFVKSRTGGGTINFTPEMQTHQTDAAFKTGVVKWPEIKLTAVLDSLRNSTVIRFNESMSNGLDFGYDAGAYKSGLDIYTKLVDDNGVDFGIQALPLTPDVEVVIPVGLESNTKGTVTLTVDIRDLPSGLKVSLEDRESGTFTPITKSGPLGTINVGTKSKLAGRFFIHATYSKNIDNITLDPQDCQIYNANGQICILGAVTDDTSAYISDLLGREVGVCKLQQSPINYIPCSNLRNGVYLVTIRQKSSVFTKKILLMN